MDLILRAWQKAGKQYAPHTICYQLKFSPNETLKMFQLFYNDIGIQSVGFRTSSERMIYYGKEDVSGDIRSDVIAFDETKDTLFGFESYETKDNLLVSLGILSTDMNCLATYEQSAGDEYFTWNDFVWKTPPPEADSIVEIGGQKFDLDEILKQVQAESYTPKSQSSDQTVTTDEEDDKKSGSSSVKVDDSSGSANIILGIAIILILIITVSVLICIYYVKNRRQTSKIQIIQSSVNKKSQ